MPSFSVIMKHTGGSCPLLKVETAKKRVGLLEKREEAAKKHGIAVLNAWSPSLEHQMFQIVEAPSRKAVEEYFTETDFTLWNKLEIQKVEAVKEQLEAAKNPRVARAVCAAWVCMRLFSTRNG